MCPRTNAIFCGRKKKTFSRLYSLIKARIKEQSRTQSISTNLHLIQYALLLLNILYYEKHSILLIICDIYLNRYCFIYLWQTVNEKSKGFWYVSTLPWSWLYEMNPQHHNIQVIMTKDNVLHIILFVQMRIDLQTKVNWNSKKTFNYGGKWGYSD